MERLPGLRQTLIAAASMAAISTFADAFWAAALPEHRAWYGIVHGGIVLGAMGGILAAMVSQGRALLGVAGGVLIGVLAAGLFYVLYGVVGVAAMLIAWVLLWAAFAAFTTTLSAATEPPSRTLTRALAAALLSGIAFWAISDIWLGPWDPGPLYMRNLLTWFVAFVPGFAALLLYRPGAR